MNESLSAHGVQISNMFVTTVPGCFDLPVTAKLLAASKSVDVIIVLGYYDENESELITGAIASSILEVHFHCHYSQLKVD